MNKYLEAIWLIIILGHSAAVVAADVEDKSAQSNFYSRSELNFGVNSIDVVHGKHPDLVTKSFHYNNNAHNGYEYKIMINNKNYIDNNGEKRRILNNYGDIYIGVGIYLEYPNGIFKMNDEINVEDPGECANSYVHFYEGDNKYLEFKYIYKEDYKMWSPSRFFIATYKLTFGEEPGFAIYYAPTHTIKTRDLYCDAREAFLAEGSKLN